MMKINTKSSNNIRLTDMIEKRDVTPINFKERKETDDRHGRETEEVKKEEWTRE